MNELVCRINDDCIDLDYIEHASSGKITKVVADKKQIVHPYNYVKPVAALDARDQPGYRNKNAPREPVFKTYDHAKPMSFLQKPKPVKKIGIMSIFLLIVVVLTAISLVIAPSTETIIIFGIALFGFVVQQLLPKEVVVASKTIN